MYIILPIIIVIIALYANNNSSYPNKNKSIVAIVPPLIDPNNKIAVFKIVSKKPTNIYQALIDGQDGTLQKQLGLSNVKTIKKLISTSCASLNKQIIIKNLHAYQFLSEQTKNTLLDSVKDICKHQYMLFSVLLNTNICIFEIKNSGNKWKCTFDSYKSTHRNIFLVNDESSASTTFSGL